MALRIGALILASCNLLSASVLNIRDDREPEKHSNELQNWGYHHGPSEAHEPLPLPGIIVQHYSIGGTSNKGEEHKQRAENDSLRQISISKKNVNFKPLRDTEYQPDPNVAKAPITIVTVPRVSTAPQTKHQVEDNHVVNHSNLPEHQNYNNYGAKLNLFDYDNLLKTKIEPVKNVKPLPKHEHEDQSKSSHQHHKLPLVHPGPLEHKVEKQLTIGNIRENALPVVTAFTVAPNHGHHEPNSREHFHEKDSSKGFKKEDDSKKEQKHNNVHIGLKVEGDSKDWEKHHEKDSKDHQNKYLKEEDNSKDHKVERWSGKHEDDSKEHKVERWSGKHEDDSKEHKHQVPVIVKALTIVNAPKEEDSKKDAHNWEHGWLGNGKQ